MLGLGLGRAWSVLTALRTGAGHSCRSQVAQHSRPLLSMAVSSFTSSSSSSPAPPPQSPLRRIPVEDLSSRDDAAAELQALAKEIASHDAAYYLRDDPEISDAEYDKLLARNKDIESRFPELTRDDSPTKRVGARITDDGTKGAFDGARHLRPLQSLDNAPNVAAIEAFMERALQQGAELGLEEVTFMGEPKIDGLSCALLYRNRQLARAATRGDGTIGEDVTAAVHAAKLAPQELPAEAPAGEVEVRGEVYLPLLKFAELNLQRDQPFATPRNAAAGSLRQLEAGEVANRGLQFFAYDVAISSDATASLPLSQVELLDMLRSWGFAPPAPLLLPVQSSGDLLGFHQELQLQRAELDFEIDGVVYKVNELSLRPALGSTARAPRWALAYKFPALQAMSTLTGVTVQVGRLGTLTPVAELEPVTIGGVKVSRASLHNSDELVRLGLRLGDVVRVARAGDVIPKVLERVSTSESGERVAMPDRCPSCGGPVLRKEDEAALRCVAGYKCPKQAVERLSHFAAKSALAITGLGRSSVEELYTDGVISTPGDIFRLKKKKDLLEGRPGWGKQSTAKLLEAIEASRSVPMERLLIGLGVPGLGDKSARLLASEFHGDMGELWQSLLSASRTEGKTEAEAEGGPRAALEERLLRIEGFGPLTVQSLFSFASEKDTQRMVDDLLSEVYVTGVGSKVVATTEDTMGALEGLRVVITGRLTDMTRSEAEALVKSQGGIASSTITKNTNLVVCGADPGPSKLEKCQKLGLRVVDEAHFRNLCDSSSHKF